ncbi:TonB-dependent receptor [Pontibacter sp. 13R65]|uniref:SusC/RagA family TonB-linked outer membrane protein n=1 Tax=Pontibacter sp. 13R65 TaxID=3127458 RepID=UPI00301CFC29
MLLLFFFTVTGVLAQGTTVSGRVINETGEGLPGVTVLMKGTTIGTSTDIDGNYTLAVPAGAGTMVFSFIGYVSKEVAIGNQTTINVSLVPDAKALDEVVVVGYGTQSKRDITGSVASVKTADLPQVANASIDNLLQGRAAGFNLSMRSAQPGGGLNINIRGAISPRGNNQPLYVIDGVPILSNNAPEPGIRNNNLGYSGGVDRSPLSTLNPADIEAIDILKDASATAIYGSAAANGVILITTKKGKAGRIVTDYRGSYTLQTPKKYFDLLNATQFMQEHNRITRDKYLHDNNLAPYGTRDPATVTPFTPRFSEAAIAGAGEGTDWLDLVMRNGHIHEHNISASGGNENTKVFTSFNFFDNKAILQNSDFKRYTGRINLEQQISSRIKANLNLSVSQINSNNASTGSNNGGVEAYNMLQTAYTYSPTVGVFNEDGSYAASYDPLITNPAAFLIIQDKSTTKRFFAAPNIEAKITDDLKANVVLGIDNQTSQRNFYLPRAVRRANLPEGMANINSNRIGNYSGEGYLTYNKTFGQNNLSVVVGGGYYKTFSDGFGLEAVDFFTDAFGYNNVGAASNKERSNMQSYRNERTKLSQFIRMNYSIADKYIFTFTGRNDGASTFAENKKWGFFPGISAAWRLSEEAFLKDVNFLSDLKFRAGYGTSGNEITGNNAIALYSVGSPFLIGQTIYNGVALSQVDNPNLSWETDITVNLGLDFAFFNNRISGSFDIFRKTAKDLLDVIPLPSNNAVGFQYANVGTTRSDGVELSLNFVNIEGPLSWTTTFNISSYKNYWVERNPVTPLAPYIEEGDRIREIYGWKTDGIINNVEDIPAHMPNARLGNVKYVDVNNDGKLDIDDVVKLGSNDPRFNLGLGNTFIYKNFDLNFFFYGFLGREIFNNYSGFYDPMLLGIQNARNTLVGIRNLWTADNPNGTLPGIANNPYAGANASGNSDFYLEKGGFVRLKNITLGYNIPISIFGASRPISAARVFVDMQNVAVFTKYRGYDPEFTQANPYPQALSTTFGLNVTF